MSDYSTYIGPFLRCVTTEKYKQEEYRGCENPECLAFHKEFALGGFCPKCGKKIASFTRKVLQRNPNPYDYVGDTFATWEDRDTHSVFCMPNGALDSSRAFWITHRQGTGWMITGQDINMKTEIEKFWAIFAKEIKAMSEIFEKISKNYSIR